MRIKKFCIALILMLFGVGVAHSQERHTEICIDFRVNSTVIDSAYSDNAVRMQEMVEFLRTIRQDSTINIIEVSFCGAASPEGSYQLNRKLARGRLEALEKLVRKEVDIPDSLITHKIFPTVSLPIMTVTFHGIISNHRLRIPDLSARTK